MTDPIETPLRRLLASVASGRLTPEEAERQIANLSITEMNDATLDLQRSARRGRPEVILCEQKSADQVLRITEKFFEAGQNVMMTRLTSEQMASLPETMGASAVEKFPEARFARIMQTEPPRKKGLIGIFAAGTSDVPVAEEAALTAESFGSPVKRAYDVGVAGLHRLFRRSELLTEARVLIVVAGMEGALPSVISGLTAAPVVAVPTSVGYGANYQGLSALLTMINSCSPGIGVVNIDNGFGGGYLADAINGSADQYP